MTDFVPGDKVSWQTSQGKTHGKVTKKLTNEAAIKGHEVKASPEDPQYEVKSDKSGKPAAHKPESLERD